MKTRNTVPFETMKIGESVFVGFNQKGQGIYWLVCCRNELDEKHFAFTKHMKQKCYEIKRVR